jgi:hypothetical protein
VEEVAGACDTQLVSREHAEEEDKGLDGRFIDRSCPLRH